MKRVVSATIYLLAVFTLMVPTAEAVLLGNDFNGVIYDVNVTTGAATNPRGTGITSLTGIAFSPGGTLFGLTTFGSSPANSLVSINPVTGAASLVGATGLPNIFEGDLEFDLSSGNFFGLCNTPNFPSAQRQLFTINPANGAATIVGTISETGGDYSALAFAPDGTLYMIDSASDQLLTVNKSTAAITSTVGLSIALGTTVGMDFSPDTGVLYVADGFLNGGTDRLYTLNSTTGVLTLVGSTGLSDGLAGLAFYIPEPSTLLLMLSATMVMSVRRRQSVPHNLV